MKTLKYILMMMVCVSLTACMDDDWSTPDLSQAPFGNNALQETNVITIAQLKSKFASVISNNSNQLIEEDIQIKGYITFLYDPLTCQISYNPDKYEFRVHSDNMSDFYMLRLDEMPGRVGQSVNGVASWTTGDDLHSKKTAFEALKFEGGRIWLWSSSSRIAVVVQTLD